MLELSSNGYASVYQPYIDILNDNSKGIVSNLEDSLKQALHLLEDLPEEKELFRYVDGKRTIKELVQHIIDAERVFVYRALTFARNDVAILPGFNENDYVLHSNANARVYRDLLEELKLVRLSPILFFKNFEGSDLK